MTLQPRISPCLWFDHQAEEAAQFYTGIFPGSHITAVTRYGESGRQHGHEPGTVMTVDFELAGQRFTALNGGPWFKFTEAISLQIFCADQAEVDHYWDKLGEGSPEEAKQCGWLKDRYGVSWQVVPEMLPALITGPDEARRERVMRALLEMKKLDIAALLSAAEG